MAPFCARVSGLEDIKKSRLKDCCGQKKGPHLYCVLHKIGANLYSKKRWEGGRRKEKPG